MNKNLIANNWIPYHGNFEHSCNWTLNMSTSTWALVDKDSGIRHKQKEKFRKKYFQFFIWIKVDQWSRCFLIFFSLNFTTLHSIQSLFKYFFFFKFYIFVLVFAFGISIVDNLRKKPSNMYHLSRSSSYMYHPPGERTQFTILKVIKFGKVNHYCYYDWDRHWKQKTQIYYYSIWFFFYNFKVCFVNTGAKW